MKQETLIINNIIKILTNIYENIKSVFFIFIALVYPNLGLYLFNFIFLNNCFIIFIFIFIFSMYFCYFVVMVICYPLLD